MTFLKSARSLLAHVVSVAVLSAGAIVSAYAAPIVLYDYEPELDAMYGQASFGTSPVDIRFLPTLTLANSSLLSIDTEAKFNQLSAIGGPVPTVYAFLTDSISFCGGAINVGIDGCGQTPGNILTFEYGVDAVVFAHELGHNLNLAHDDVSVGNIMGSGSGFDDRLFTFEQTAEILSSPLVQTDALGRFIQIQLYSIVADEPSNPVPEPSTAVLVLAALGAIGLSARRRKENRA